MSPHTTRLRTIRRQRSTSAQYTRKSRGTRAPPSPRRIRELSIPAVSGKIVSQKNGWTILHIHGNAYSRGFAHGAFLSGPLHRLVESLPFWVKQDYRTTLAEYVARCRRRIGRHFTEKYREYSEELVGISEGAKSRGVDISVDILLAWNAYLSMTEEYGRSNKERVPRRPSRCSAFIATGDATERGDIVMAHNTNCSFLNAVFANIILYITPEKGHAFVMQTCPGLLCSSMDWFITANGMVGCETTIARINYRPQFGSPYFARIRDCMQYGNSLEEYADIMQRDNAGDYACSWLFGDIRTGEIMLCEIGLRAHHIVKTKNGVYYGMNSAIDPVLRWTETDDRTFYDRETSSGARNARLEYLLRVKYAGKLNAENAKRILADHYDVYLGKERKGIRGICKHGELEPEPGAGHTRRRPYFPHGTIDGKVVNTAMAKQMRFWGKYGASCNRSFSVRSFLASHPEYSEWREYLVDLPNRPWTNIGPPSPKN